MVEVSKEYTDLFIDHNNILKVGSNQLYKTINSALSVKKPGEIILLSPETFNEDVIIEDDETILKGIHPNLTKIKNLTILSKNNKLSNFTVSGDFTLICEDDWVWTYECNYFERMTFQNNCYLGTSLVENTYPFRFFNCEFTGISNTGTPVIALNGGLGDGNIFENCRINSLINDNYYIKFYKGRCSFSKCRLVEFGKLTYENIDTTKQINFYLCDNVSISALIVNSITSSNYNELTVKDCTLFQYFTWIGKPTWTFSGKFELDVFRTGWVMPNIIFNSTMASRITQVCEYGYNNNSSITGTGLSSLYIQHSIFHCSAPVGLGEDINNSWTAFTDD